MAPESAQIWYLSFAPWCLMKGLDSRHVSYNRPSSYIEWSGGPSNGLGERRKKNVLNQGQILAFHIFEKRKRHLWEITVTIRHCARYNNHKLKWMEACLYWYPWVSPVGVETLFNRLDSQENSLGECPQMRTKKLKYQTLKFSHSPKRWYFSQIKHFRKFPRFDISAWP